MIARVTAWSARHPRKVLLAAALIAAGSYGTQRSLSRDVIPDLSDPQLVLVAEWMGHPARDVAAQVAEPLTRALDGVSGSTAVRGTSMSGMAYVDVVFGSTSALAQGRAEIVRRVDSLRAHLPAAVRVQVGPEASSTGWVFQYALLPADKGHAMPMAEKAHEGDRELLPLRRFQDEVLRPALAAVPGVAEVATVGGERNDLLIETTSDQLAGAGVAFSDVVAAVRARTQAGATREQLEATALTLPAVTPGGRPNATTLGTVARVRLAPEMPSGVFDVDGRGSMVGGIVIAKRDADVRAVIERVKAVIERERHALPIGARLGVIYDRSELAEQVEQTLFRALTEEVVVVALVVLVFLLHGRSALVPMLTLPLVVVMTFAAMRLLGIPATVMSLGGIAIALGMAVDADLVALEACHRRLESAVVVTGRDRLERIAAATSSFAPAILTSLVIAALAFLPVFAFGGETGRLLRPLALTKTLVIVAAAVVTLTVGPALRAGVLRGRIVPELGNPITRTLVRVYRPFVHFALDRPAFTLVTAALAVVSCLPIIPRIGAEFLPRVDEGSLLFMPTTAPGVNDHDAAADLVEQDATIAERLEVAAVFGKIGRAETATDPAPFSMAETIVRLRPRAEWPAIARRRWYSGWAPETLKRPLRWLWPDQTPPTTAELVDLLDHAVRLPGWTNAWTAPVRARMDMMSTGVRTPVGIRVVAPTFARLDALGAALRAAVATVPGTKSAVYERLDAETRLSFVADVEAMRRYDVEPVFVRATAELLIAGGFLGELRAPGDAGARNGGATRVRVSLDAPWLPRTPDDLLREATVRAGRAGTGQPVPLGLLGRPVYVEEPAMPRSDRGELAAYVYVDVDVGADLAGYVASARKRVDAAVASTLGPGERIEWTGQYELLAAGQRRLKVIVPVVALSMLLLLFLQFRSVTEALIVLVSVPSALVGSFWTVYLLGYRLSAPVWVGMLSVVGLAMQTGVLMVVYIDDAFHRRMREGNLKTRDDIVAAHAEGTVRRLRPKAMTIGTMAAALMPLLWSQGAGAEIMKRVAAPMIGGLVSSAFLTLEVIPVVYTIWRTRQLRAAARKQVPLEDLIGASPTWAQNTPA